MSNYILLGQSQHNLTNPPRWSINNHVDRGNLFDTVCSREYKHRMMSELLQEKEERKSREGGLL